MTTQAVERMRKPRTVKVRQDLLSDRDYWAQHLGPGEKLIWAGRPDDSFRLSGMNFALAWFFAGSNLVFALILFLNTGETSTTKSIVLCLAFAIISAAVVFGPPKLDQSNRKARRYAVTTERVLAVRDARHERPKQIAFSWETKVVCTTEHDVSQHVNHMTDDSREYRILAFANMNHAKEVTESLQFERLDIERVREIHAAIASVGASR